MKKFFSLIMAAAIVFTLLPAAIVMAAQGSDFEVDGDSAGYTYGADGVLTFTATGSYTISMAEGVSQTATDKIAITAQGSVSLTLDDVNIDVSATENACALDISGGSSVSLTLTGGNTLKSGMGKAGLHVPAGAELTINGEGSLIAVGSIEADPYVCAGGAGIGGNALESNGAITINNGTVIATSGYHPAYPGSVSDGGGAGIGSGGKADAGEVTINGGVVIASSNGKRGAGLGGGANCGTVTINGGRVTATGGSFGPGIGGGLGNGYHGNGGTVTITGGTVYARGGGGDAYYDGAPGIGGSGGKFIGGSGGDTNGAPGTLTITGGSVRAVGGGAAESASPAKDAAGSPLYLTTVYLQGDPDMPVNLLKITHDGADYPWGITDMYTNEAAVLYLYLPNGAETTVVEIEGSDVCYKGSITTDTSGTASGELYYAYTVRFETNGGTPVDTLYIPVAEVGVLHRPTAIPQCDGYWFALAYSGGIPLANASGWYKTPGCEDENRWVFIEDTGTPDILSGSMTLYAKWVPAQYNITYDLAGGENNLVNPNTYTIESGPIALAAPTRTGYDFAGWSGTGITVVTRNVTISAGSMGERNYTAHWTTAGYRTVTFDAAGGTPATQTKSVKLNNTMTAPKSPTYAGYTFKGWLKPDGITLWNFSKDKVTDNITLYAKWAPNSYKVTFNSNGGSAVAYRNVVFDTLVTKPADPTRTGYDFGGWYKESGLKTAWDFLTGKMPAKAITLYAKWNPHRWDVTFNSMGGNPVDGLDDVAYYSTIPAPLIPAKEHCTFKGWYKDSAYKKAWSFSKDRVPDRVLTLYAKWQPDAYKVTFNPQGGSKISGKTGYWGLPLSTPKSPSRTGYKFDGWYTDNTEYAHKWVFGTGGDVVTGVTTLYAKWTANTFTVTFNAGGGTLAPGTVSPAVVNYGSTISMPLAPTREGYYFGGWYTSTKYTAQWGLGSKVTKSMTLYAKWMTSPYKITFNANGGAPTPGPAYAQAYGTIDEPEQPTRAGYDFIGWYKSKTSFTEANIWCFGGKPASRVTGSVTLYARWIPSAYKVTFNANGGSAITPALVNVTRGEAVAAQSPADPTRAGCFFGGWYTSKTKFTDAYKWNLAETPVTKAVTLYARWVKTLSAPTFTAASNGADSVLITINPVPYANGYFIQYSTSPAFKSAATEYTDSDHLTANITSLDAAYIWYFRTQACFTPDGGVTNYLSAKSTTVAETPGKPGPILVTASSYNSVHVEWSGSGIYRNTGYEVWRATSAKGKYYLVGTKNAAGTSFDNLSLKTGATYWYKVRAYKQVGKTKVYGAFTVAVSAKPTLAAPVLLSPPSVVLSPTSLRINWNAVAGASGYEVWRATADSGVFKLYKSLKSGAVASYTNTGLRTDQPYYYKVRAYRTVGRKKVYSGFAPMIIATPGF